MKNEAGSEMEGVCGDRNAQLLVVGGGGLEARAWKVIFLPFQFSHWSPASLIK